MDDEPRWVDPSLQALRDSEARYRDLVENSHDIIQSVSPDGQFVFVNRTWTRVFGHENTDGLTLWDLIHPESLDHCKLVFEQLMNGQSPSPIEATFLAADGRHVLVEGIATLTTRGGVVTTHAFLHDVTEREQQRQEREQLLAELHHSRKMEALGRLTGGVAHDFNNLLTVILGNLDLMEPRGEDVELAEGALSAAMRATSLVERLLAFARPRPLTRETVEIGAVVQDMLPLLRRTLPASVAIVTERRDEGVCCLVDRSQLENVVLNLAVNARDAMPDGGRLTLTTRLDGSHVLLDVRDTGAGMPADVAERAFEPFFTTKSEGKGTGLGLSSVYGFAKQSGGRAMISSELARGTAVCLALPVPDRAFG